MFKRFILFATLLLISNYYIYSFGGDIPSGLPNYFGFGVNDKADAYAPAGPHFWKDDQGTTCWDYSYAYLVPGWATWQPNGGWAKQELQHWESKGQIQVFTYYYSYGNTGFFTSTSNMQGYFNDLKLLFQVINQYSTKVVIVHFEPDGIGFWRQQGKSPTQNGVVMVGSTGIPEISDLPDTIQGWSEAIYRLRNLYAPNKALLAHHFTHWATGADIFAGVQTQSEVNNHVDDMCNYISQIENGKKFDLIFVDPSDRDADWYRIFKGLTNRWTDPSHTWTDYRSWGKIGYIVNRVSENLNRRIFMWQIPVGNTYYKTCNNSSGHYRDNHAQEFLPSTSNDGSSGTPGDAYSPNDTSKGPGFWAQRGVIGVLFGSGYYQDKPPGGEYLTHVRDYPNDGITNPGSDANSGGPSYNVWGKATSDVSDNDGGYIRYAVAEYCARGKYILPGSGTTPTDTPTETYTFTLTPTLTPTNTNTDTFTQTETPTNTFTLTPTDTLTPTNTYTDTFILTETPTDTPTNTNTYTYTLTQQATDTPTSTNTQTILTYTPTFTETYTETNTNTYTNTYTPTSTPQATDTSTSTNTQVIPTDTPTPTNTTSTTDYLLDNMDDGDNQNNPGGYWYTYDDYDNGGDSVVWPYPQHVTDTPFVMSSPGYGGVGYAARITGYVTDTYQYGFVGMGMQLNANAGAPTYQETDISSCSGIKFYAKGNGEIYTIKIPYTDNTGASLTGYDDYHYNFTAGSTWTLYEIPFSLFSQDGWGTSVDIQTVLQHAKEIQFQTTSQNVAVDLWIDEIYLLNCNPYPDTPTPTDTIQQTTNTNTPTPTDTIQQATDTYTPTATDTTQQATNTPTPTNTMQVATTTYTPTPTYTQSDELKIVEETPVVSYPNPYRTDKDLTIKFNITKNADLVIFRLYTVAGRLITDYAVKKELIAGENKVNIPKRYLEGLANGTYYYVILINDEKKEVRSRIGKIIIMK